MKILVGGFRQESNSFSAHISTEKTYAVIRGEEFFDPVLNPPRTMLSGILSGVVEAGAEIVPAVEYTATAGGPVLQEVVDGFLQEFLKTYDDNAPIQAIFLELHGATDMVPSQDACGYILETIRKHVGPDIVLVHTADMHANISDRMMANADGVAGYLTFPHKDFYTTGRRAAMHGLMLLRGEPFAQARVRIPMVVPAEGYSTDSGCFAELMDRWQERVENQEILDFTVCQMQPWLDLSDAASTVLVTARDRKTAADYAQKLAHELFDLRKEMRVDLYHIDEVIDAAKSNQTAAPVVLVDSADSPNAGSSADSSFLLNRLLERGENIKTCLTVADVPAVQQAFEVGVGNEGEFMLGGTKEPAFQKPVRVHAYVKSLHDGIYMGKTSHCNLQRAGKSAVLQVGNIDIVVFSQMGNSSDPQVYRAFGLEPADYRLVMVKSAGQYKQAYSQFSTLFYPTDTPGSSSANLRNMPFRHLPRPFFPLDDIAEFDDAVTFYGTAEKC